MNTLNMLRSLYRPTPVPAQERSLRMSEKSWKNAKSLAKLIGLDYVYQMTTVAWWLLFWVAKNGPRDGFICLLDDQMIVRGQRPIREVLQMPRFFDQKTEEISERESA